MEVINSFAGGELASIFVRSADRRYWSGLLYGDFRRMQPPGDGVVVRAVVDDFGSLVRVSS